MKSASLGPARAGRLDAGQPRRGLCSAFSLIRVPAVFLPPCSTAETYLPELRARGFAVLPGDYTVYVGTSSEDTPFRSVLTVS